MRLFLALVAQLLLEVVQNFLLLAALLHVAGPAAGPQFPELVEFCDLLRCFAVIEFVLVAVVL